MVRKETVITTAEFYCRRTKHIMGEDCYHPINTCLYFNDLALLQAETGRARRITPDDAILILRDAEEAGLVHNISNCEGKISSLCNCCVCSRWAMESLKFGAVTLACLRASWSTKQLKIARFAGGAWSPAQWRSYPLTAGACRSTCRAASAEVSVSSIARRAA